MAWLPGAIVKNIPPGGNDPVITPVGVILHVRAGTGDSLYPYFNGPSGGIESHFYIRFDGTVEQYRDTTREADANHHGNSWSASSGRRGFISVETEGVEHGSWTSAQLASIKKLLAWASKMHNFPLRVCPGSKSSGVGYHVLFGAPGPWTPVAKSCPGPKRIAQFNDNIVPWMTSGETLPDTGEDEDMPLNEDDKRWLQKLVTPLSDRLDAIEEEMVTRSWMKKAINVEVDAVVEEGLADMPRRVQAYQGKDDDVSAYTRTKRMAEDVEDIKGVVGEQD